MRQRSISIGFDYEVMRIWSGLVTAPTNWTRSTTTTDLERFRFQIVSLRKMVECSLNSLNVSTNLTTSLTFGVNNSTSKELVNPTNTNKYRGGTSDATTSSSLIVSLIIMLMMTFYSQKRSYSSFENNTGRTDEHNLLQICVVAFKNYKKIDQRCRHTSARMSARYRRRPHSITRWCL